VRRTRGNILKVLTALHDRGALVERLELREEARRLLVLIMGMAVQVMFDPEDWSNARQHELVDAQLRRLFRPDRVPASIAA
jgi:hypothetical protein